MDDINPGGGISIHTDKGRELVHRAREYACREHQRIDHRRKYSRQPYEDHLAAVAKQVAAVTDDAEMIAAAWLHDIVEDTPVTAEDVAANFGASVTALVMELTDPSRPADGNRAIRKAIDRNHLASASGRAQTIKLADLCDNAPDIVDADPAFGRVFLAEMEALLAVLTRADPGLWNKAKALHGQCATQIRPLPDHQEGPVVPQAPALGNRQQVALRRQMNTFTVADLARPLLSLDATQTIMAARQLMAHEGVDILGIRDAGRLRGYLTREHLDQPGTCAEGMQLIDPGQCLDGTASLSNMVHVLTQHTHAFVTLLGEVHGIAARVDLHQPIGRMWLFGMVTLADMTFTHLVRTQWPEESWQDMISPGRLDKARQLRQERSRRGHSVSLLECLQLSDKASILLHAPEQLAAWGFRSRKSAQSHLRDLDDLRNHLAHSQDFADRHWAQIVRLTRRYDEGLGQLEERPDNMASHQSAL